MLKAEGMVGLVDPFSGVMAGPKQKLDSAGERNDYCVGWNSNSPAVPRLAMAVWATHNHFRKLVAYVLTDDAALAIQTVKQMGYLGLKWEAELVTLLPWAE
jgi:hypothetical protein